MNGTIGTFTFRKGSYALEESTAELTKWGGIALVIWLFAPDSSVVRHLFDRAIASPLYSVAGLLAVACLFFLLKWLRAGTFRLLIDDTFVHFQSGHRIYRRNARVFRSDIRNVTTAAGAIEQRAKAKTVYLFTTGTGGVDLVIPNLSDTDADRLVSILSIEEA